MNKKSVVLLALIVVLAVTLSLGHYFTNEKKNKISKLEEKKENIGEDIDDITTDINENVKKINYLSSQEYRSKVLELDTYYSFVTGYWPRLYMKDKAENSELISWAVNEAITNPEYESDVNKEWDSKNPDQNFLEAAEYVEEIYNFVVQNMKYKYDDNNFNGRKEVYIPPDYIIEEIKKGNTPYGDCEDMAIILTTMYWHLDLKKPSLNIKNIRNNEGIVILPRNITVYATKTWDGLVPLYYEWNYGYMGHSWPTLEIPHYSGQGHIRVALEPTQKVRNNEPAPWDTWVKGSPVAESIKKDGWVIHAPKPYDNLDINYPLQGYEEGHKWTEEDIWRGYGENIVDDYRYSDQFPDKNKRRGRLRGDPLYWYDQNRKEVEGTLHLADLSNWRIDMGLSQDYEKTRDIPKIEGNPWQISKRVKIIENKIKEEESTIVS